MTTLLAVYDGADNLLMRFEYADSRLPVSMTSGGGEYFLLYDQVGSLRAVTDSSGNIVKQVDYDSFGNVIGDSNSSFEVPFGFAGGLYDTDTGLVRFGFRDYDPALGRWTAKDPIDFAGGDWNLYGYCLGDPVNWVDPWGLDYTRNGIIYDDCGNVIGEVGLEAPNPFLDPVNYIAVAGGVALAGWQGPWLGKIAHHTAHAGGPHKYHHIQIMIRVGRSITKSLRIPWPW